MSGYSTTILAHPSLVAYYRLGENSGTQASDSKGTSHGTYTGGFTLSAAGGLTGDADTAVDLNGSSGYIDLPFLLSPAADISLECYVMFDALASDRAIVSVRDGTGTGRTLLQYAIASGQITSNIAGFQRLSGVTPTTGTWYHVVFTSASGGSRPWAFYIDGAQTATGTSAGETPPTGGWVIGATKALANFLDGKVDEVSVYNAVLSADTVGEHYKASKGVFTRRRALLGVG